MLIIYLLSTDYFSFLELRRTGTGHALAIATHLAEYAILGGLWFWVVAGSLNRWDNRAALLALGTTSAYAVFDEMHQYFTLERTAVFTDVILDWVGALSALIAIWALPRIKLILWKTHSWNRS